MIKLNEEQLKTLKLFSYYCASHGARLASQDIYIQDCNVDWHDKYWYSETGTKIDGYDKIDHLIDYLIHETNLVKDNCSYEGSSRLDMILDVKERNLTIKGYHTEYTTSDGSANFFDKFDDSEFNNFFEELSGLDGVLDFSGGGDSGWIENNIRLSNGSSIGCPAFLEDWGYHQLSINYGGWEINEGSQGSFEIDSKNKTITLTLYINSEEFVSDGDIFSVNF